MQVDWRYIYGWVIWRVKSSERRGSVDWKNESGGGSVELAFTPRGFGSSPKHTLNSSSCIRTKIKFFLSTVSLSDSASDTEMDLRNRRKRCIIKDKERLGLKCGARSSAPPVAGRGAVLTILGAVVSQHNDLQHLFPCQKSTRSRRQISILKILFNLQVAELSNLLRGVVISKGACL